MVLVCEQAHSCGQASQQGTVGRYSVAGANMPYHLYGTSVLEGQACHYCKARKPQRNSAGTPGVHLHTLVPIPVYPLLDHKQAAFALCYSCEPCQTIPGTIGTASDCIYNCNSPEPNACAPSKRPYPHAHLLARSCCSAHLARMPQSLPSPITAPAWSCASSYQLLRYTKITSRVQWRKGSSLRQSDP